MQEPGSWVVGEEAESRIAAVNYHSPARSNNHNPKRDDQLTGLHVTPGGVHKVEDIRVGLLDDIEVVPVH
jgi:hypothetical protein